MSAPSPAVDDRPALDAAAERPAGGDRRTLLAAALVGVFAFAVSVTGSWIPSAWADEAATMSAARRSLPELWHMVHHVDAVHGLYYAMMHVWFEAVPYSVATLRLPSAIAIGLAAAVTVLLGARLVGPWTGLVAGVVFAVLPRVTWAGAEGRSYAATTLFAVVLSLVLVVAVQRTAERRRRAWVWWLLYGVAVLCCGLLFVDMLLLVAAHGVALFVGILLGRGPGGRRAHLRTALWWLVPTVVAGALLLPFVRLASGEANQQLYYMGRMGWGFGIVKLVFLQQFFAGTKAMAAVAWLLVAIGAVGAVVVPRLRDRLPAVALTLPAVFLPPAVVYVASVLVRPLFNPRYFTFETPLLAIAIALGLTVLPWRRTAVLGLALLVLLAVPQWGAQRIPTAKDDSTWGPASALLQRERAAEPAGTRDGIVHGPLPSHVNRTTEFVAASYPRAFQGMRDLTLERSAVDIGQLWAQRRPASGPLSGLTNVDRVWFVGEPTADEPRLLQRRLTSAGWHVVGRWREHAFLLLEFERR